MRAVFIATTLLIFSVAAYNWYAAGVVQRKVIA